MSHCACALQSPSALLAGMFISNAPSLGHIPPPCRETQAPACRMIATLTPLANVQLPAHIGESTASVIVGVAYLLLGLLGARSCHSIPSGGVVSGGAGAISGPLRMRASVPFSASRVDGDIFPLGPFYFCFLSLWPRMETLCHVRRSRAGTWR